MPHLTLTFAALAATTLFLYFSLGLIDAYTPLSNAPSTRAALGQAKLGLTLAGGAFAFGASVREFTGQDWISAVAVCVALIGLLIGLHHIKRYAYKEALTAWEKTHSDGASPPSAILLWKWPFGKIGQRRLSKRLARLERVPSRVFSSLPYADGVVTQDGPVLFEIDLDGTVKEQALSPKF